MDAVELTEALAARLGEVIPSAFVVEARGGDLAIWPRNDPNHGCAVRVATILDQPGDRDYFVGAACYSVLDTVQDVITTDTSEPWPAPSALTPGVHIENGRVSLWYGDQASPSLVLRPIYLTG